MFVKHRTELTDLSNQVLMNSLKGDCDHPPMMTLSPRRMRDPPCPGTPNRTRRAAMLGQVPAVTVECPTRRTLSASSLQGQSSARPSRAIAVRAGPPRGGQEAEARIESGAQRDVAAFAPSSERPAFLVSAAQDTATVRLARATAAPPTEVATSPSARPTTMPRARQQRPARPSTVRKSSDHEFRPAPIRSDPDGP
jgi:hypothetical protein